MRFSVRTILFAMIIVGVGLALYKSMRGPPRPFVSIDSIIAGRASDRALNGAQWEIHTSPDVDGPYRTIGDDWKGTLPYRTNPGQAFRIWIDLKSGRRTIYPASAKYFIFDHST